MVRNRSEHGSPNGGVSVLCVYLCKECGVSVQGVWNVFMQGDGVSVQGCQCCVFACGVFVCVCVLNMNANLKSCLIRIFIASTFVLT